MKVRWIIPVVLSGVCLAVGSGGAGGGEGGGGKQVLNVYSYWRSHVTLRPVLFGTAEKAAIHEKGSLAVNSRNKKATVPPDRPNTPLPPEDWKQPGFDDARWWRDPGPFFGSVGKHRTLRPHSNRYGIYQPSTIALAVFSGSPW